MILSTLKTAIVQISCSRMQLLPVCLLGFCFGMVPVVPLGEMTGRQFDVLTELRRLNPEAPRIQALRRVLVGGEVQAEVAKETGIQTSNLSKAKGLYREGLELARAVILDEFEQAV